MCLCMLREREREITWGCLGTEIESSLMEQEMMRGVKSILRFEWRKIMKRTFLWLHWGTITRRDEQIEDIFYEFLRTITVEKGGFTNNMGSLKRKEQTFCLLSFAHDKPQPNLQVNNIHQSPSSG